MAVFTLIGMAGIDLPVPQQIASENGMKILLLEDHSLPIVSFKIIIDGAGTAFEPAGIEGISDFAAELVLKGNAKMTAEQISEELDFMGAELRIISNSEYVSISGYTLKEYLPKVIEILSDSLLNPSFSQGEIENERFKRLENLKSIKDQASRALMPYMKKAYFGSHPMANLAMGNEESLKKMTPEELKSYFSKYYRPDLASIAVVGDITKEELEKEFNKGLMNWKNPGTEKPVYKMPAFPEIKGKKLLLIDKPDATQSYFMISSPGFNKSDPIAPEAEVVQTLFGGRFTSWLNTELRIKRGLTYGARSRMDSWKDDGVISIYSYTANKNIQQMLDIVFDLLNKTATTGFEAKEVESARNYILGQFPPTLQRNSAKASTLLELEYYNLGKNYYSTLLDNVSKAETTKVNKAAVKILPSNDYVLVVIGKAEEIKPLLAKYGEWETKKVSDSGF